ncbi:MAG: exodeoxyribonuclease VII small subunit [Sciscionella sp.]|nr:exodeoxyribonuclease VII small subunit [Sciscionella sp.]
MTEAADERLGYEAARDELADVVAKLESGGLSLEDSLALWERGEALAKLCERHLAGARRRVDDALARAEVAADPDEGDDLNEIVDPDESP